MKSKILSLFFLALVGLRATGQEASPSFYIHIDRDTVLLGNVVKVSFVADNVDGKFTPPTLEGFEVVSGPNTSSQMSMINGTVNKKSVYYYLLVAKEIGVLTIPPAYLDGDNSFETIPTDITILPNEDGIIERDIGNGSIFEFGFPSTPVPPNPPPTTPDKTKKKRKLKKI